jgi:hypothetical protein
MKNSMANAYDSYKKVIDVITNADNQLRHIPAIDQLIKNYADKFPEEPKLTESLEEFAFDLKRILKK